MSYKNKIVWITGASSGIGEALAIELASQGAILVLSARSSDKLAAVCAKCDQSDRHLCLPLDVTNVSQREAAFQTILETHSKLDVLILNAGIGQRGAILETEESTERRIMEVNFFGYTALTHLVLPHMVAQNAGQLVVIGSVMSFVATPRRSMYAASKHATQGFFEALRAELHGTAIKMTIICPGYIKTDISLGALTGSGRPFGEMDEQHQNAMSASTFAKKALKSMQRNKKLVFIGGPERFGPLLMRISPRLVRFLLPRIITRD